MDELEFYFYAKFRGDDKALMTTLFPNPDTPVELHSYAEFPSTAVKLNTIGVAIMSSYFELSIAGQTQLWVPLWTDSGCYIHYVEFGLTMSSPEFSVMQKAPSLSIPRIMVLKALVEESVTSELLGKIIHAVAPDIKGLKVAHRYGGGWSVTNKLAETEPPYTLSLLLGATQPVDEGKCRP